MDPTGGLRNPSPTQGHLDQVLGLPTDPTSSMPQHVARQRQNCMGCRPLGLYHKEASPGME